MIFSDHFKRTLKFLLAGSTLLLLCFVYIKHKLHDIVVPPRVALPRNDQEIITYNENRHIITVTTAQGMKKTYSRNPTVEIHKDGTVKVDSHPYGFEVRPFLGVGYSDTGRVYLGTQLLYFWQFDASASFGFTANGSKNIIQPMLAVGYNFWSETSLNLGLNPASYVLSQKPEIAVFLSVRL